MRIVRLFKCSKAEILHEHQLDVSVAELNPHPLQFIVSFIIFMRASLLGLKVKNVDQIVLSKVKTAKSL